MVLFHTCKLKLKFYRPFIADKPDAPGQPEVVEVSQNQAVLHWAAPASDGGSPITNYRIEAHPLGTLRWDLCNISDVVTNNTYTVTGLREDTEYEFRVIAENKTGRGNPSVASFPVKIGLLKSLFVYYILFNVLAVTFKSIDDLFEKLNILKVFVEHY